VLDALAARVEHGVFGYSSPPEELRSAIVERLASRYGWRVDPAWIIFLPGVVPGLHISARRLLAPNERALVPSPAYQHFKRAVELAPRPHTDVPLVLERGRWVFDTDVLRTPARLAYLCNPQNPGGTVFTRAELSQFAELTRDAIIVSDEIHCDLVLDAAARHMPIASLAPEISRRTVTLMSANKAFNIPAAGCAWAVMQVSNAGSGDAVYFSKIGPLPLGGPRCDVFVATNNSFWRNVLLRDDVGGGDDACQPGAKSYSNRFFDARVWYWRGGTVSVARIALACPHARDAGPSLERRSLWEAGVRPCDGDLRRPDRHGPR